LNGWRRIFKQILALLLVIGLAAATARAQQNTISLADYRARLAEALESLERGGPVDDALPPSARVQLPSGETIAPAPLFAEDSEPAVASARISTVIQQIDLSARDNTAARLAQLERVAQRLDLLQPSLWERFLRWLADWLDRLLPDSSPLAGGALGSATATAVGWAVIAVGGLLLTLLLSYWLRRLLAGMLAGRDGGDPLAGADDLPVTSGQARQQASEQAQSGNYREAVRRLYLAAILRLAEQGLIRFERSLTNREVLARVDASAPARAHLAPVVETFDRVWYGEQEPDEVTFHVYSREIDALLREETADVPNPDHEEGTVTRRG
jgi:hypothetical protein